MDMTLEDGSLCFQQLLYCGWRIPEGLPENRIKVADTVIANLLRHLLNGKGIVLQQIKGPLHAQGADIFRNAFSLGQPEAFLQLVLVDADLPAKVNDRRRVLQAGLQDSLCLFYRTNLVLVEIDRRLCG